MTRARNERLTTVVPVRFTPVSLFLSSCSTVPVPSSYCGSPLSKLPDLLLGRLKQNQRQHRSPEADRSSRQELPSIQDLSRCS